LAVPVATEKHGTPDKSGEQRIKSDLAKIYAVVNTCQLRVSPDIASGEPSMPEWLKHAIIICGLAGAVTAIFALV
jgi:hypothetical protein